MAKSSEATMPGKSCLNFADFVSLHKVQLGESAVPERYWHALYEKLKDEVFDAGSSFMIQRVEECSEDEAENVNNGDGDGVTAGGDGPDGAGQPIGDNTGGQGEGAANTEGEYSWQVVVNREDGIDLTDPSHIYLIDHAWTYRVDHARRQLEEVDGLLSRMAAIMDIDLHGKSCQELIHTVMSEMWKYNQTYNIANATLGSDDAVPIWYIMDEFGSRIQHSDTPSFRLVPFYYVPAQISFTIMWPMTTLEDGDEVTRNFIEGVTDPLLRQIRLNPWHLHSWTHLSYEQCEMDEQFFLKYKVHESVPNLDVKFPVLPQDRRIKVYTDVDQISQYLTDEHFEFVEEVETADILWTKEYLRDFKSFSEDTPQKRINQFPFEMVVTVKDLMAMVARRAPICQPPCEATLETHPKWLATTYNLQTELPQFVSYFQHRESGGLDNHWICKPWNLARALDMHITNNLSYILHLPDTGPKIACKYLEDPVLWTRPGIGQVKFDLRYAVMLYSVKPLQVYIHRSFHPRFANKPFTLNDLDNYETHFTVMNYKDGVKLCEINCSDFMVEWKTQHPEHAWSDVEAAIFDVIKELFVAATSKEPPRGIGHSPQSRAVYGIDIILQWTTDEKGNKQIQPVLLECNFGLDLTRHCRHQPTFCNEMFSTLFLDTGEGDRVTRL